MADKDFVDTKKQYLKHLISVNDEINKVLSASEALQRDGTFEIIKNNPVYIETNDNNVDFDFKE